MSSTASVETNISGDALDVIVVSSLKSKAR
jgi:hypothetical protein